MGLSSDLEQVFLDNLSDAGTESVEVDAQQQAKIRQLSQGISNAIINFLTKQTFTITEMKATVELDGLRTTGPITTEAQITTAVAGSVGIARPGQPILNSLNLGNTGGQGGVLETVGYAYLGKSSPMGEDNSDETQVKLIPENIVGE